MLDLAAYFRRIGYQGEVAPTLHVLQQLHALHTQSIPFENLSPFLGADVFLDTESLSGKLIRSGRGGWCFEHNLLFKRVLEQIGFTVTGLAARVRLTLGDDAPPGATSLTHMLLLVRVEEAGFIADVGFGGLTLTTPLELQTGIEQNTWHEVFRLVQVDETHHETYQTYRLQARLARGAGEWRSLYDFDLHPMQEADYALTNWYLAHHPGSLFVNSLMAARAAPGRRHTLCDTRYTVHYVDGRSKTYDLADVKALLKTLREIFHIRLVASPKLESGLARLFQH